MESSVTAVGRPIGILYAWWRGDPLPALLPVPGLEIGPSDDPTPVVGASGATLASLRRRLERGHRLYLARLGDDVVGWGWAATREGAVGELGLAFAIPPRGRYLWDFVTLPAWRGRGIYPRVIQAMLEEEDADRFWIGHDLENVASGRGILRAGFRPVGEVYALPGGGLALAPVGPLERARAGADLFGIPVAEPPAGRAS